MQVSSQATGQPRVVTVALCASAKKHAQSFVVLERCAAAHNAHVLAASATEEDPTTNNKINVSDNKVNNNESPVRLDETVTFRFLHLLYDAERACMTLVQPPVPSQGKSNDSMKSEEDVSNKGNNVVVEEVWEVDVVLHKVATFGSAAAKAALETWCNAVQVARKAHGKAPLVLLDPLDRVEQLVSRRSLYTVLSHMPHDDGMHGGPLAFIPHTFVWCRGQTTVTSVDDMSHSAQQVEEKDKSLNKLIVQETQGMFTRTRCCGAAGSQSEGGWWWVAKPEEGTGPAYTHYLVLWRREEPVVLPPRDVQDRMPPEATRFIIQEFYLHALPVVVKVYCIADALFIDVRGTSRLLQQLVANKMTVSGGESVAPSETSSDYALSTEPSLSEAVSTTTPTVTRSFCIDSQDSGLFSSMRSTSMSVHGVQDEKALAACWNAFFAPGTAAHRCMTRLARRLSSTTSGLGLSLYGFDVLLVPRHLAHEEQRRACAGIGYDKDDETAQRVCEGESESSDMYDPAALFDLPSQVPTRLLRGCVPIVVDVNYFPGYKGVETASAHMLNLLQRKVETAQQACTSVDE